MTKAFTHPKICFILYSPPPKLSSYRIATITAEKVSRIPQRIESLELENRVAFAESLESAWLDGARVLVILGPEAFNALGHEGRFIDFRGTWLQPRDLETNRPWKVMATIDPNSKAAYIRNGYDTYRSDLRKALEVADSGVLNTKPEHIVSGADLNQIIHVLREIPSGSTVACDIESDGLSALKGAEPVCLGIAWDSSNALVIPWRRGHGISFWSAGEESLLLNELKSFFKTHQSVWHNGVWFDIPFLITNHWPLELLGDYMDTIMMHRKIDPDSPHSLSYISSRYSSRDYWKDDFKNRPGSIYNMNPLTLWTYNARDAMATFEIYEKMLKELPADFSMTVAPLVIAKKLHQIVFDSDTMELFRTEARKDLKIIENKLCALGSLPEGFNFNSNVHLNAFIFGLKKTAVQKRIVDESSLKAKEVQTKLANFDADHSTWSQERAKKAHDRFESALAKIPTTAKYLDAKSHLDLMNSIKPLYQATKLSFLPKVRRDGLYSFDDITREKLLHQLSRKKSMLASNLERQSRGSERFVPGWKSDLESITQLETWLKLYEYRIWLTSLIGSIGQNEDVTGMPLEFLYRFGHYFKPTIGSEFFTAVAPPGGFSETKLQGLVRLIATHQSDAFVILIRSECVTIEAPASLSSGIASLFDLSRCKNLTEALRFMEEPNETLG